MRNMAKAALAATMLVASQGAAAQGLVIEGNGARTQGAWGAELGAGYEFAAGPITVRPGGGAFVPLEDEGGDLRLYARAEATVTVPLVAELGVGARFSGDRTRLYGTAAFAILPRIKMKANVGERYVALGLMARQ